VSPRELAWPCENVAPGMAPVAAILAQTEETVVAVTGIRAYPAGFGFTLNLRLRSIAPPDPRMFWPFQISRTTVAASRPPMGSCV
jgi:hypothetical protein